MTKFRTKHRRRDSANYVVSGARLTLYKARNAIAISPVTIDAPTSNNLFVEFCELSNWKALNMFRKLRIEMSHVSFFILILCVKIVDPQSLNDYTNPLETPSEIRHQGNLFIKVGKLANGLSYGHISLSINLTKLEVRIGYFRNTTENLKTKEHELDKIKMVNPIMQRSMKRQINQMRKWLEVQLKETDLKLETVTKAFEPSTYTGHPRNKRNKRQAVSFGAAGLIFGGIIGSLFTGFGLKTLTSVIEKKQDVLATQIEEHEMLIHRSIDDVVRINATLAQIITEVSSQIESQRMIDADFMSLFSAWFITEDLRDMQNTIDGIIAAHHGHFSHELVNSKALQDAVNQLRSLALRKGKEIAIQTYADCYGLPTSYLYDAEQKIIHLIIHLPMYAISSNLDLYTYVPTPITWQNGSQDTPFVEITSDQQHLAMSKDRTMYRTFTTDQLEDCMTISDTHFCQDLAMYKIQRPSCLLGLFIDQTDMVRKYCSIQTHIASSKVVRLNATTYAMMSPFEDDLTITCQSNDRQTRAFRGTTFVNLQPGCTVNSKEIKIVRAEFEPPIVIESLLIGHHFDVEDLLPEHSAGELEHLFQLRRELGAVGTEIPLSDLKGLMNFRQRYHGVKAQTADILTPVLITAILIAIIVLTCCCCWIRNPKCSDSILHRSHNARIADIERRYSASYKPAPIIKHRPSVDLVISRRSSIGDVAQFDEYDDASVIHHDYMETPDEDSPPIQFYIEKGARPKRSKNKNGSVKRNRNKTITTDVVSFPVNTTAITNMPYTLTNPEYPGKVDDKIQQSANNLPDPKPSAPPQDVADLWLPRKVQNVNLHPYENVTKELNRV